MMKLLAKITLVNVMCLSAMPVLADDTSTQYNSQQTSENTQNIAKYLLNLGKFLGYDVSKFPPDNNQNQTVSSTLLNPTGAQTMQLYLINTFLGANPVNAFNAALAQILPTSAPGSSSFNAFANAVFVGQNYNSPQSQQQGGGGQGMVTVSTLIDQQNFQPDPVNQSILNILGTPNYSYCMNGSNWISDCNLLFDNKVSKNVIGTIPSTYQYFTYDYNQQFLSQLNTNSLLGPLMYSTEGNGTTSPNIGLPAQSQAQQAQNFIRYVSGSVTPTPLPKLKDYDQLFVQANPSSSSSTTVEEKYQAQSILSNYFASLRTYAAQSSVGISNLYFIMSKRLPQSQGGASETPPSSQASTEFTMATRRLYNPDMSVNNQWINQLNNASTATVEKEIALLLAEINYQMYLDRQIHERILLTNSVNLLQNTKSAQPNPDFASSPAAQEQQSSQ